MFNITPVQRKPRHTRREYYYRSLWTKKNLAFVVILVYTIMKHVPETVLSSLS